MHHHTVVVNTTVGALKADLGFAVHPGNRVLHHVFMVGLLFVHGKVHTAFGLFATAAVGIGECLAAQEDCAIDSGTHGLSGSWPLLSSLYQPLQLAINALEPGSDIVFEFSDVLLLQRTHL